MVSPYRSFKIPLFDQNVGLFFTLILEPFCLPKWLPRGTLFGTKIDPNIDQNLISKKDGPKRAPRPAKSSPGRPRDAPRAPQELPREAPGRPKSSPGGPKRRPGGSPGGRNLENPLRFLRLKSLKSVNCKCDVGIQCFSSSLFFAFPFFLKVLPNPVGFFYRSSVPLMELSEGSEGREGRMGRKGRGIANFLGSGR